MEMKKNIKNKGLLDFGCPEKYLKIFKENIGQRLAYWILAARKIIFKKINKKGPGKKDYWNSVAQKIFQK